MIDLEGLTKEELIALITALNDKGGEQVHHPDSLMAMMLANPKESRVISWRMQHPLTRAFIIVFCILTVFAFLFAGLLFLSI